MKNFKTILVMAITILGANSAFAACNGAQWAAADAACGSISSNMSAYACNAGSGFGGTAEIGCAPDLCLSDAGGGSVKPIYGCGQTYTFTIFVPKTVAPTRR